MLPVVRPFEDMRSERLTYSRMCCDRRRSAIARERKHEGCRNLLMMGKCVLGMLCCMLEGLAEFGVFSLASTMERLSA
jgi:hypothetical protein